MLTRHIKADWRFDGTPMVMPGLFRRMSTAPVESGREEHSPPKFDSGMLADTLKPLLILMQLVVGRP